MLSSALAVALTITALPLAGAMSVAPPARQDPAEEAPPAYASSPRLQGVGTGLAPRLIDQLLAEDAAVAADPAPVRDSSAIPAAGNASADDADPAKRIDLRLEAPPLRAPPGRDRLTDPRDVPLRLPVADVLELHSGAQRNGEPWPRDPLSILGIRVAR